jgi:hypothetical protein
MVKLAGGAARPADSPSGAGRRWRRAGSPRRVRGASVVDEGAQIEEAIKFDYPTFSDVMTSSALAEELEAQRLRLPE